MEIELGCFSVERTHSEKTFLVPQLRLNYGMVRSWEVVGEFEVAEPADESVQLASPGLFLKGVLKEGILQEQEGASFAVEAGPLLPSTLSGEKHLGLEGIGILSGQLFPLTYHLNIGGGLNRARADPFVMWGLITEMPVLPNFRLVGEINGESVEKERADNSGLLGFIWKPSAANVFIDLGVRKGLSTAAPDWGVTTGVTFSYFVGPGTNGI